MKQIYKSIFACFLLLFIFLIIIDINYNKDVTNFCKNNFSCTINLINQTKNISICENFNNSNLCYQKVSIKENNFSICYKIVNNSKILDCLLKFANYKNNLSICNLAQNLSTKCYFNLAIKNNNLSICNLSNNSSFCIYSYAIYKNNSKICNLTKRYKKICKHKLLS